MEMTVKEEAPAGSNCNSALHHIQDHHRRDPQRHRDLIWLMQGAQLEAAAARDPECAGTSLRSGWQRRLEAEVPLADATAAAVENRQPSPHTCPASHAYRK